jgi:hypothetical protein
MTTTEIVGYAASIVLMISFLLGDMRKLRLVNTLGCALFVVYGVYLGWKWPIIIPNTFIIGVNIIHLARMARKSG